MIHTESETETTKATPEQKSLFPKQEEIKKLQSRVESNYTRASGRLKEAVELGKFFKAFGEFCGMLNNVKVTDPDRVLLENIRAGKAQAAQISDIMDSAEKQILEAHELIAKINALDEEIKNPNKEPKEEDDAPPVKTKKRQKLPEALEGPI